MGTLPVTMLFDQLTVFVNKAIIIYMYIFT